jgi:CubicO group peptidase (beta-lactamase class C family)
MRSILLLLVALPAFADDAANFKAAAEYSKTHTGEALVIFKGDKLVFEEYFNGYKADRPHVLFSGTKSFAGIVAACAVDDGLLTWDELAADTLTEWKDDSKKSKITLRHLLSLTSGLDVGGLRMPTYAEAIKSPARHDPGTKFEYGSVPYQCFGEVMRRKLKPANEDYLAYLKRKVLTPIGLDVGRWLPERDGNPQLPSGCMLTAREWAKFGLLLKHDGEWNGKALVKKESLAECLKPGTVQPKYGLTFWLGSQQDKGVTPDAGKFFMAAGLNAQRLYVLKEADLVVVHFADGNTLDDREMLKKLLGK